MVADEGTGTPSVRPAWTPGTGRRERRGRAPRSLQLHGIDKVSSLVVIFPVRIPRVSLAASLQKQLLPHSPSRTQAAGVRGLPLPHHADHVAHGLLLGGRLPVHPRVWHQQVSQPGHGRVLPPRAAHRHAVRGLALAVQLLLPLPLRLLHSNDQVPHAGARLRLWRGPGRGAVLGQLSAQHGSHRRRRRGLRAGRAKPGFQGPLPAAGRAAL